MSTQHIKMGGAPEGYDAQLVLRELHSHGEPVVHIARDDKRMSAIAETLAFFAPDLPVIKFPAWDCVPYDRVSPNADVAAARMATLAALVHDMPTGFVLLTTMNAATQALIFSTLLSLDINTRVLGSGI